MRIVVLAHKRGETLAPLTDRLPMALLPIAGKPLLHYTLESLAVSGVEAATIVVSAHAEKVERSIETGERWGVRLDVRLARGDESVADMARELSRDGESTLLVRADVLRSELFAEVIRRIDSVEGAVVRVRAGGEWAGIDLCRGRAAASRIESEPSGGDVAVLDIDEHRAMHLDSLADFHAANLRAAAGEFPGLQLAGRAVTKELRLGRRSRLSILSVRGGPVSVGANVRVHPRAELHGHVVLNDDVVIDARASLRSTVVLPNSYIGELLELENAIVQEKMLIRVDTGTIVHISDDFLLGDLKSASLRLALGHVLSRWTAVLAFCVSLPLWPLAFLLALVQSPRRPVQRRRFLGNRFRASLDGHRERVPFTSWEFTTFAPVLRHLPLLLAVAREHLRMVGVRPIEATLSADREIWEQALDDAPAGLIGPAQLLPPDAPAEERELTDAFYARTRSLRGDLVLFARGLRALVSLRAWIPRFSAANDARRRRREARRLAVRASSAAAATITTSGAVDERQNEPEPSTDTAHERAAHERATHDSVEAAEETKQETEALVG